MRNLTFLSKWCTPLGVPVFIAWLACLTVGIALTQAQVKRYNADRKQDQLAVERLLSEQAPIPPGQAEVFDAFFNEFVFPEFLDSKSANRLPKLRADLRRYFLLGKSGEPYERLNKLTRDFVQQVLRQSKAPPLCYNAVLILGDLNEFEAVGTKKMKPLPAALPDLVNLLSGEKQPEYIHVAALVGALRHAALSDEYPLAPETKADLSQAALAILKQTQVPPSHSPSSHAYVRRSAAELLGYLGGIGNNGEIVHAVLAAANDPRWPLSMRLGLLHVLGMFRYGNHAKLDFASILSTVGHTAVEAAEAELKRAATLAEERPEEIDPDRRRLSYIFRQAQWALDGPAARRGGIVAGASNTPAERAIKAVSAKVSNILKKLDKDEYVDAAEFTNLIADIQADLPAKAKAARVSAGGASEPDQPDEK